MALKRSSSISSSPAKINNDKSLTKAYSCKICGDNAHIVYYGALSCQACKTFFRRNGFHPELVRQCKYDGQCEVNKITRYVCTSCRLAKCFTVGMSTDFIRKEVLHGKRSSSMTESNKPQLSKCKTIMPLSQLSTLDFLHNDRSLLTASQWKLFSNILYAFDVFSLIPKLDCILKNLSISPNEVHFDAIDAIETIGPMYTSMQSFISSTPDFQVLSINEQQSLFERNLHGIASFYSNLVIRDTGLFENPKCFQSYVIAYGSETMEQSNQLVKRVDLDSTLFKLMLIIIVFSSNCFIVDMNKHMFKDSLIFGTFRLFGSQNVYVELLWKYMIYQYGYMNTILRFNKLVKHILDMIKHAAIVYTNHMIYHEFIDHVVEKTKKKLVINQNELIPLWGKTLIPS